MSNSAKIAAWTHHSAPQTPAICSKVSGDDLRTIFERNSDMILTGADDLLHHSQKIILRHCNLIAGGNDRLAFDH